MATTADLNKLVENLKRVQAITSRAASDTARHTGIMDAFEQRMNVNDETMMKLAELEKAMAVMDLGSNGGPALDATFPSSTAVPAVGLVSSSTIGVGKHGS